MSTTSTAPSPATGPWAERRERETPKWHARALRYIALPPETRSVRAAYLAESAGIAGKERLGASGTPSAWLRAAERFVWDERATQYDAARDEAEAERKRRKQEAEEEAEAAVRKAWRDARLEVISTLTEQAKLGLAMVDMEEHPPSLGEAVLAASRVVAVIDRALDADTSPATVGGGRSFAMIPALIAAGIQEDAARVTLTDWNQMMREEAARRGLTDSLSEDIHGDH